MAIQLCYYRGMDEFYASPWLTQPQALLAQMDAVQCRAGSTQLAHLLKHYLASGTPMTPVRGLVFIGDAIEENADTLEQLAGQCRLKSQPLFLFQEGNDPQVAAHFGKLARLSGGAHVKFESGSADKLRELLGAVVRFVSGGHKALTSSGRESDKILLSQLPGA